jgi:transcriptional regulator with XRE-family HTH domain
MATRERPVERASTRARHLITDLGRELHTARVDRALSLRVVGQATELSASQISRIERGVAPQLTIVQIARLLAAVGLELSVRAYPTGEPIRDIAHARLLESLRRQLHRGLVWRTEVPFPMQGDLRAWDAVIRGRGWSVGVECETRPRDVQALDRRLALKERDGRLDRVVLLLRDSVHNRRFLRVWPGTATRFSVAGNEALAALRSGRDPGGNAVIRL